MSQVLQQLCDVDSVGTRSGLTPGAVGMFQTIREKRTVFFVVPSAEKDSAHEIQKEKVIFPIWTTSAL